MAYQLMMARLAIKELFRIHFWIILILVATSWPLSCRGDLSQPGSFAAGSTIVTITRSDASTLSALMYYPATMSGLDAPLDPTGGPYSAITFGHGFLQQPARYYGTLEHLATHGYLMIAPTSEIGDLVGRLIEGDLAESQAVVHSLLTAGTSHTAMITEWLLPAMREVGRRWENNELAIFQEHLATETLRRLLAGLTASAGESEPLRRTAIVSCVPGDEHQLLPLALGIFLELRGWRVRSLGGGLPPREIAAAVAAFSPVALFLSFPMLSGLDEALETICRVLAKTPPCRILIGGRGAVTARTPLERAGARAALDFEEAHLAALEEVPRA